MSAEGDSFTAQKSMEGVYAFLDAVYQEADKDLRFVSRNNMSDRLFFAIEHRGDVDGVERSVPLLVFSEDGDAAETVLLRRRLRFLFLRVHDAERLSRAGRVKGSLTIEATSFGGDGLKDKVEKFDADVGHRISLRVGKVHAREI